MAKRLAKRVETEQAPELQWVDPNTLEPASWNPPERTTANSLVDLAASMERWGFWPEEPIVIAQDERSPTPHLVVADGHRRLKAALRAKLPLVAIVHVKRMSAQEYWAEKNGLIRPPSVKETGTAIKLGLERIPAARKRTINGLLTVYGGDWEELRKILERGATLSVINAAMRIINYCDMQNEPEFVRQVINWLIDHKMSLSSSRAITDGIDPDLLFEKVMSNQPIVAGYS